MVHGTSTIEKIFQNTKPLAKKHAIKKSQQNAYFPRGKHMLPSTVPQQTIGRFTLHCLPEFL